MNTGDNELIKLIARHSILAGDLDSRHQAHIKNNVEYAINKGCLDLYVIFPDIDEAERVKVREAVYTSVEHAVQHTLEHVVSLEGYRGLHGNQQSGRLAQAAVEDALENQLDVIKQLWEEVST